MNEGSLETKATSQSNDIIEAFDSMMHAFEDYKHTNDERLESLEKGRADSLTDEKLARIDGALNEYKGRLDRLQLKAQRPVLERAYANQDIEVSEHKQAFQAYVRRGDESLIKDLSLKAMSAGSDPDGGFTVPLETENMITQRLSDISPIRSISSVRQISSSIFKKPFNTTGIESAWAAETASRTQSTTPVLDELIFPTAELYAMPAATPALLEDSVVDIESWIASEVESAFAEQETKAFINGDGVNKPEGFLNATKVAEDSWAWKNLGYIASGEDGEFASTNASDSLVELIYALKAGYRQNAHFVMNRKTQSVIRKIKDGDGNYIWNPPGALNMPATLMNFAITEAEDMPDIASDSYAIAFGDFKRGYLIVDRQGVTILRDPFSSKPYVLFYTTKRVGGGVMDYDAIKLLKFGTS